MQKKFYVLYFLALFFITSLLNSCANYKAVPYFRDLSDSAKPSLIKTVPFKPFTIQPDDLLAITIQTLDDNVSALLNSTKSVNGASSSTPISSSPTNTGGATNQAQIPNGNLVDKNGEVELAFVGKVKVAGLTIEEAKTEIKKEADKYFKDAIVNVRFANFKVTIIGEVAHPSTYVIPNERINIFDALGLAGDLTIFGRRENLLLMRDSADGKALVRLNLNSKDIVASPYFYLQRNDVLYIEPSKYKVASVDAVRNRNITILASFLSVMLVVASRVIK